MNNTLEPLADEDVFRFPGPESNSEAEYRELVEAIARGDKVKTATVQRVLLVTGRDLKALALDRRALVRRQALLEDLATEAPAEKGGIAARLRKINEDRQAIAEQMEALKAKSDRLGTEGAQLIEQERSGERQWINDRKAIVRQLISGCERGTVPGVEGKALEARMMAANAIKAQCDRLQAGRSIIERQLHKLNVDAAEKAVEGKLFQLSNFDADEQTASNAPNIQRLQREIAEARGVLDLAAELRAKSDAAYQQQLALMARHRLALVDLFRWNNLSLAKA
jgi:hypothetical protein